MGVKQNTAEVRHRQPVGLGSRKISTATVGENEQVAPTVCYSEPPRAHQL